MLLRQLCSLVSLRASPWTPGSIVGGFQIRPPTCRTLATSKHPPGLRFCGRDPSCVAVRCRNARPTLRIDGGCPFGREASGRTGESPIHSSAVFHVREVCCYSERGSPLVASAILSRLLLVWSAACRNAREQSHLWIREYIPCLRTFRAFSSHVSGYTQRGSSGKGKASCREHSGKIQLLHLGRGWWTLKHRARHQLSEVDQAKTGDPRQAFCDGMPFFLPSLKGRAGDAAGAVIRELSSLCMPC